MYMLVNLTNSITFCPYRLWSNRLVSKQAPWSWKEGDGVWEAVFWITITLSSSYQKSLITWLFRNHTGIWIWNFSPFEANIRNSWDEIFFISNVACEWTSLDERSGRRRYCVTNWQICGVYIVSCSVVGEKKVNTQWFSFKNSSVSIKLVV